MFDILGKNKKKEDIIISIISVSKLTSIQEISEVSNLSTDDVCMIIEKMIVKSKTDSHYKLFKNAHINKKTNEVVIEKYTKSNTIGVSNILNKILPGASNADWKCKFCGVSNKIKNNNCTSCGALNK